MVKNDHGIKVVRFHYREQLTGKAYQELYENIINSIRYDITIR
jgi:hypothetical protein